jgi:hypothetical protein
VLAALVVLAACGDDGDDDVSTADATDEVPSTPAPSDVTLPSDPTVTIATAPPTVPGGGPCTSPDEAAQAFHDAWAVGDQEAAGRCATQVAIDTLFGGPSGPAAGEIYQGCLGPEAPTTCAYSYEGGAIIFTIGVSDVSYVVESVEFVAD